MPAGTSNPIPFGNVFQQRSSGNLVQATVNGKTVYVHESTLGLDACSLQSHGTHAHNQAQNPYIQLQSAETSTAIGGKGLLTGESCKYLSD